MNYSEVLRQVIEISVARETMTPGQRHAAMVDLAGTGLFSNRQLNTITGVRMSEIAKVTGKDTRRGGKFLPEAAPLLLELALATPRDQPEVAGRVLESGLVSANMAAKLTGVPVSSLTRWARQGGTRFKS